MKKCLFIRLIAVGLVALAAGLARAASVPLTPSDDIVTRIAAATAGEEFSLAAGTYDLSAPLVVSVGCTVEGAGPGKTILNQTNVNCHVVELKNSKAVVSGCTITGARYTNKEGKSGCGVSIASGGGTVTNCHVIGNFGCQWNYVAGVYCASSDGLVTHCVVSNNTVSSNNGTQGGMYFTAGRADHCLVCGNYGHQTGGICLAGPATISYCTVVNNSTYSSWTSSVGGGIAILVNGATVENSIIYGNTCPDKYPDTIGGKPEISCYGTDNNNKTIHTATFTNCAFPDTITLPSGVLGTPIQYEVPFIDFANGNYRQKGYSATKDIGYYTPFQDGTDLVCDCTVSKKSLLTGTQITFNSLVGGTNGTDTLTYLWTVTKPDKTTETLTAANPVYTPTQRGDYSVRLTVTRNGTESEDSDHTRSFLTFAEQTPIATSAELAKALSNLVAGVTLVLGEGTFELTSAADLSMANAILGAGPGKTILKQTSTNRHVVKLRNSAATVSGCTLTGANFTDEYKSGCGVCILDESGAGGGTVTNCHIIGNTGCQWNYGVGVYCESANGFVTHCVVSNNISKGINGTQGGLYFTAGRADHCLVCGNTGDQGGGVCLAGPATFSYCTIVANKIGNSSWTKSGGGGIAILVNGGTVENSIIYGNTCHDQSTETGKPEISCHSPDTTDKTVHTATFTNCAFPKTVTMPSGALGTWFQCEVQFKDFANGDYHQKISSPAKDIGYYTPYDSGSEFCCEITGEKTAFLLGDTVQLNSFVGGTNGSDVITYAWTVTKPDATTEVLTEANPLYAPAQAGDHAVTLSITKNETLTTNAPTTVAFTAYATPTVVPTVTDLEKIMSNTCNGLVLALAEGTFDLTKRLDLLIPMTIRGAGRDKTILRATHKGVQAVKLEHAQAVLEDLTVTGGDVSSAEGIHGAGVYVVAGTVRDCRMTCNYIRKGWTYGAGVALDGADARVERCIIDHNEITTPCNYFGAGVYLSGGVLDNCLVYGNSLTDHGAGNGTWQYRGGGIHVGGSCQILNCTVANNSAVDGGGGLYIYDKKIVHIVCGITNTIFAGNTTIEGRDTTVGKPEWAVGWGNGGSVKIEAAGCLFGAGTVTNEVTGAGWLVADPRFRNPDENKYRLRRGSPSIRSGVLYDDISGTDLDGRPRANTPHPDMGCYGFGIGLVFFLE